MADGPVTLHAGHDPDGSGADVVDRVVTTLRAGGVVILPTDTVYGVTAHPGHTGAIARLFAIKGRARSAPLAVLATDATDALGLFDTSSATDEWVGTVTTMAAAAWPGALTLVGPRTPAWRAIDLGGDPATIGVRVPDSPLVRAVTREVGPIAATSANRSGSPTPTDATVAAADLGHDVDLVVDTGPCGAVASTVVDVTVTPFRVLRRGSVDPASLGVAPGWFEPATTERSA